LVIEGDLDLLAGILGGVLLLFGRRLYFVLLGVAGFALGWYLVSSPLLVELGVEVAPNIRLVVGLVVGIACALLAVMVHNVALAIAGLVLGAVSGILVVDALAMPWQWLALVVVVVAAVSGMLLLRGLFEIALMVLSAFIGSSLIVGVTSLAGAPALLLGIGLWIVGVAVQGRGQRKRPSQRERQRGERAQAA
jgi:hypothetical protein